MQTLSETMFRVDAFGTTAAHVVKTTCKELKDKVVGGDHTLVVSFILIAIAVGLCLAFRTSVAEILSIVVSSVKTSVQTMVQEVSVTDGGSTGGVTG